MEQAQVRGGGLARARPSQCDRRWQREAASEKCSGDWSRCWPLCLLVNAAEWRELTATVFETYLVPCAEPVTGRFYHEAAGAIKDRPRQNAQRLTNSSVPRSCTYGMAFLRSLAATKGLAPEHVATVKTCWEGDVVKSSPVQLAAHVRHCRAKSCMKIVGKEEWMHIVF